MSDPQNSGVCVCVDFWSEIRACTQHFNLYFRRYLHLLHATFKRPLIWGWHMQILTHAHTIRDLWTCIIHRCYGKSFEEGYFYLSFTSYKSWNYSIYPCAVVRINSILLVGTPKNPSSPMLVVKIPGFQSTHKFDKIRVHLETIASTVRPFHMALHILWSLSSPPNPETFKIRTGNEQYNVRNIWTGFRTRWDGISCTAQILGVLGIEWMNEWMKSWMNEWKVYLS